MKKNDLGVRVKAFRQAKQWTAQKMADEVGTSRQNIENLELKGFGQPRYIAGLARVMGVSVDDLLGTPHTGGARSSTSPPNATFDTKGLSLVNVQSIPSLDFKDARLMEVMNDDPRLASAPRIAATADSGPRTKALRIEDESMLEAGINPGDLATFDPDLAASPGDIVLVVDQAGVHHVREYRARKGGQFEAAARNPSYPSFQSAEDGLRVVAVATHVVKSLRRRGGVGSSLLGVVGFFLASLVIAASDIYLPMQDDEHNHPPARPTRRFDAVFA